jgi:hypothetical protein
LKPGNKNVFFSAKYLPARVPKRLICKSSVGIYTITEEEDDEKMCQMRQQPH